MTYTEISDGGLIQYNSTFMPTNIAKHLFQYCVDKVPWQQEKGRYANFPRLTYWYADPGLIYKYSGVTHQAAEWLPAFQKVREKVEKATGQKFNSLLMNYYRDGKDSIGWHTDAEPELGENPIIASLSLGATRRFLMKSMKEKEILEYDLVSGSLLVMGGTSQHHWLHSVPKELDEVGGRVNFTFRNIVGGSK